MEISPQLMQQLQVIFKAELAEHLETITSNLLENIFRAAHSLKGAAKGVSQHAIADITHRLESIFNLFKKGQLPHSTALFNTILQVIDKIKQFSETAPINPEELKSVLEKLDSYLDRQTSKDNAPASTAWIQLSTTPVEIKKASAFLIQSPQNDASPVLSPENSAQASYSVLIEDVKTLSLVAEEVQISRLQLKTHLLDFQQLCLHLDHLSSHLNEYISLQSLNSRDEKLTHSITELSHLSANALDSFNNLRQLNTHLHQVSQSLATSVNTMRLVPFAMLLAPLHRIVRDLSLRQQKKLSFVIEGEEVKIDRNLYKALHAPLVHLITNAIDHGIELPEERLLLGKPEQAQLRLKITKHAANIVVFLSDDGHGIDLNAIREKIIKLQWLPAHEVKALSKEAVLDFIFKAGFSLAPILTETSGRGVGLDVVKTNLRKIQGSIAINSVFKQGTEFILTLPAALTSESGILIRVNDKKFALRGYSIERVIDVRSTELVFLNGKNLLPTPQGQPLNIYYLSHLLGMEIRLLGQENILATVLITDGQEKIAVIVDSIMGEQDLMIKPFSYPLLSVPFAVGVTMLGNGELIPVLHAGDLITATLNIQDSVMAQVEIAQPSVLQKILVVDDSPTSRTLEKNILEQQGFVVSAFSNGLQAWQELQKNPHYQLVLTDIEMPLMNGFELVAQIKSHPATRDIPTIIISSLNSEQDKRRGVQVGADAYITKDAFDSQRLLTIIKQLL
jgi:two-component system, chemotaxis family, sensor kinase CheA